MHKVSLEQKVYYFSEKAVVERQDVRQSHQEKIVYEQKKQENGKNENFRDDQGRFWKNDYNIKSDSSN